MLPISTFYKYDNEDVNKSVQEFDILYYKSKDHQISDLLDFVRLYKDRRINIFFPDGVDVGAVKDAAAVNDDVAVRLDASDLTIIPALQESEIKFFCSNSLPAYNRVTLTSFLDLGVSDIYIADDLCYDLKEVRRICQSKNVRMRMILNRIPSTTFDKGVSPKTMFFCPKDIDLLRQYFDIFEFDCGSTPKDYDWAKFDVLRRAWFDRKDWHGDLIEINDDLHFSVHCDILLPTLLEHKLNCERRCDGRLNNTCRKCTQYLALGHTLFEKNIQVSSKKKEEENA